MSDPDDIDEVFRDLRRFAAGGKEPFDIDDDTFHDVPQLEPVEDENAPEDELILGGDYVTYLVYAEKGGVEDFLVVAEEDSIQVKTEDFSVRRTIESRVDPREPVRSHYSNGVLSIRVKTLVRRDTEA